MRSFASSLSLIFCVGVLFSAPLMAAVDSLYLMRDGDALLLKRSTDADHAHAIKDAFSEEGLRWTNLVLPGKKPFLLQADFFEVKSGFQAEFEPLETKMLGKRMRGTGVGDILIGGSGKQILEGLGGDDLLQGGSGPDSYVFHDGSGRDVIDEQGNDRDKILFGKKVQWHGLRLALDGEDVLLSFVGNPHDEIRIKRGVSGKKSLENVGFYQGHSFDLKQIREKDGNIRYLYQQGGVGKIVAEGKTAPFHMQGTEWPDLLVAADGNDILDAKGGADALYAGGGDDRLILDGEDDFVDGGEGYDTAEVVTDDGIHLVLADHNLESAIGGEGGDKFDATGVDTAVRLEGHGGNDNLTAGAKGGVLLGGQGNDKYRVGLETGFVSIQEEGAATDRIILDEAVTEKDVTLVRGESDLYIFIGKTAGVRIEGQYMPEQADSRVEFLVFEGANVKERDLSSPLSIPTAMPPGKDITVFPETDNTTEKGAGS